jgi:hypothetical protein
VTGFLSTCGARIFVSVQVELNQSSASSITGDFFEFNKRRQLFSRTHNETLSVVASA